MIMKTSKLMEGLILNPESPMPNILGQLARLREVLSDNAHLRAMVDANLEEILKIRDVK